MTVTQLESRLTFIENHMAVAGPKDLPYLTATYQKLMDRLVALDMAGKTEEPTTAPDRPTAG